jgi:uncharacterized protein YoxC
MDLESLEDIPISIVTRGRHALCLKCRNSKGAYEKHLSFSSESQFISWRSSLETTIQSRSHDLDFFSPPPVDIALPLPPQCVTTIDLAIQCHDWEPFDGLDFKLTKSSNLVSSGSVENFAEPSHSIIYDDSSTHRLHSSLNTSSRGSFSDSPIEHVHFFEDYPAISPLMNALLSVDEFTAPMSSKNVPATVAVNLLRLNARAVAAASVETKFETDTLVSSLKQSIYHLQTSKDELIQELESLKDFSKQSISSQQALLEEKDAKISILNSQLRHIYSACGLETDDFTKSIEFIAALQEKLSLQSAATLQIYRSCGIDADDPAKLIEFIAALQEKFTLQSTATFMLQSEIEFTRQSTIRAAALHASVVQTKNSEIENLACALESKNSEIKKLLACLQAHAEKAKNYELANGKIREDSIRHQSESDARISMFQHNVEMKIQGISSERDALIIENGKMANDIQAKRSEVDNLQSSLLTQSENIQSKNSEIQDLVYQVRHQTDTIKDLELFIARISEEAGRTQKEAEMRMVMYQHSAEMRIQVLSSERDMLQSSIQSDAETLKRFRDKYVAALADNSLLLETIRILNNSIAQMQVQLCELESKIESKDLELSSCKSCFHELIRETDSNRQLLHSAIDLHTHFVSSRGLDSEQVEALLRQPSPVLQRGPRENSNLVFHQTDKQRAKILTGNESLDLQFLVSTTGKGQTNRSPNASGGSAPPLSPMMASANILQNMHVHTSPSSLEPVIDTISPDQDQKYAALASDAGQHSRGWRLPLPLPGDDPHMIGELKDVNC